MDERGIDVALLYKPKDFEVLNSETFSVYLLNDLGLQDYTRDILLVTGKLNDETIPVMVNHWLSKREGEKETEHKRFTASNKVNSIIRGLKNNYSKLKIKVMGDFNDNPNSNSIE